MLELRETAQFAQRLDSLRDIRERARVQARFDRLAQSNPGEARPVGEGVCELRINHGPGYRAHLQARGREPNVLAAGGHKGERIAIRLSQWCRGF